MAIDVETLPPLSGEITETGAGFLALRMARALQDRQRRDRLDLLDCWFRGDPPLPGMARNARDALQEFHRHCRTGFAALIVEALRERQRVRGIRTSVDADATGDAEAWDLWLRMKMPLVSADALRLKGRFGESAILVSPPADDDPETPIATAEDPRQVVFEVDPLRPWLPRYGFKTFRDQDMGLDLAYLYRKGRVDVAAREINRRGAKSTTPVMFGSEGWNWAPEMRPEVPEGLMPLVPFMNLDGVAEFEPHLDLLRRINFMILQRLTVATLQAFRQRALKGAPNKDDSGKFVDYNDIFTADPGAIWLLPESAEMWESGQVDLGPLVQATMEDLRQLSAVSRTPMNTLMPSGENQSAEGAAFAREGLVFKVEDRNARDEHGLSQVMAAAYRWLGDEERAKASAISIIWAPPQRSSLAERANAMAQANQGGVPWQTRMIAYGEHDPSEVDLMQAERDEELLFSQRLAAVKIASQPEPPAAQELERPPGEEPSGGPES